MSYLRDTTNKVLAIFLFAIYVSKFGILFASAQKNLGIAGVTLIIIREDLLGKALDITPNIWNYKLLAENKSSINTVPVFPIYVMDLMVDWVISQGGVKQLGIINQRKAEKLYNYIDTSDFYLNNVKKEYRSTVNIPFLLRDETLLSKFLIDANNYNLKYLNGHISVGGARASLYNAMPESGVDMLISFMKYFAVN